MGSNERVFEEVRRIVNHHGGKHSTQHEVVLLELAEAYPECSVEHGADAWREGQGEPRNKFP